MLEAGVISDPIIGNSICDALWYTPRLVIEHSPEFPHVRVENDSNELLVECDLVVRQLMHACDFFSVFPCCVVSFLATDHLDGRIATGDTFQKAFLEGWQPVDDGSKRDTQ